MYGGQCFGVYHTSVMSFVYEAAKRGHSVEFAYTFNESLIQRARNTIASMFLMHSKADVLLFIDSDIRFDPVEMVNMVEEGKDIVGAITPTKAINFGGTYMGIQKDQSIQNANKYGGFFNFNKDLTKEDEIAIKNNESFIVDRIGTGVMAIKRSVLKKMASVVKSYKDDNPLYPEKDRFDFFPVTIEYDEEWGANRMMSEDYNFCNKWVSMGGKVYARNGVVLGHNGYYEFTGDYKYDLEVQEYFKNNKQ
jgi:glycosyltransferase involved in cell wall biosynthesis